MRILEYPTPIESKDNKIVKNLVDKILSLSVSLKHIPINSTQKQAIFHQELLKSSLFSAKIEGNQLTLIQAKQIDLTNPQKKSALEISNVLKARNKISLIPKKLKLKDILKVHKTVMKNLHQNAGEFRTESSAIFDQYGNIVYLTPSPEEVNLMSTIFLKKVNQEHKNTKDQLVTIAQSHYYFEKIHPFLDGNGRTGRILTHYQLHSTKLFDDFALPIEEYLNINKSEYYDLLEKNTTKILPFTVFFLKAITWALKKLLEDIKNIDVYEDKNIQSREDQKNSLSKIKNKQIQQLLPRRQEILRIIEDHPHSSFDFISRRFVSIPKRTLAYDVAQLVKKDLIIKHGKTRGVVYSVVEGLGNS